MEAKNIFSIPVQQLAHTVEQGDFEYFRDTIRSLAGIALSDAKKELLQSRLRSRVQALGLEGFSDYRSLLESLPREHPEWQEFVNLLTTNKTDWFREPAHFDYILRELLPQWKKKGKRKINIWSAACSTGEEPYTLSMVLNRAFTPLGMSYEILATDIDTEVVKHARNGVYRKAQLDQIPPEYRGDAFSFGQGEIANWMKVRSNLKLPIHFERFNLMTSNYPWKEKFDLILCRNVLIYFPKDVVGQVVQRFFHASVLGGTLMIGHSESVQNLGHSWKYVKPSVMVKESRT